jgi:hypothetical protein
VPDPLGGAVTVATVAVAVVITVLLVVSESG